MNTGTKKLGAQSLAARLVEREVYYCASTLVSEVTQLLDDCGSGHNLSTDYDDALDLMTSPVDYEEAATENGWKIVRDTFVREDKYGNPEASARLFDWDLAKVAERENEDDGTGYCYGFVREAGATYERTLVAVVEADDEDEAWDKLCDKLELQRYEIDEDADDWQELCDNQRIDADDYRSEVYEHWIVSDWLARKLAARGQITGDFFGLTIWGRCCTGQSISLDHVIQQIAIELWEDEYNGKPYDGE